MVFLKAKEAHRTILTARHRVAVFDLPGDDAALLRHDTLADDDIAHIRARRRSQNQPGFALQLCVFRYPGHLLTAQDVLPAAVIKFIAAQPGMRAADLDGYAVREETRRDHLIDLRAICGYKMFTGRGARDLKGWLEVVADAQATDRPTIFLRRGSKWHRHLQARDPGDHRLWEVAVLFHLREAFRSGDIWLTHSRRYADLKNALVPIAAVQTTPRLVVPFDPADWLADRKTRMAEALERLAAAAKAGAIPGGTIEDGSLKIERLSAAVPAEAEDLVLDMYKRLPDIRITDLLLEVDEATGFTEAFTHIRTGAPCTDRIGVARMSFWPKA